MASFKVPSRYDKTTATEGVWTPEFEDHKFQSWGKYKVGLLSGIDPRVKKYREAWKVKNKHLLRNSPELVDYVALQREIFIKFSLLDWEGIENEDGPVPYSVEAAREWFMIPEVDDFILPKLVEFAEDVTNFGEADPKDIEGN